MPNPTSLQDYLVFCSSGVAGVLGLGDLLKLFPDAQSVVTAGVLALVGAFVGGSVKLVFDIIRKRMKI